MHHRWTAGVMAAGVLAAAAACSPPVESAGKGKAETTAAVTEAPSETVTPLFEHALPHVEGKTFTSVVVAFPPSARAEPHRHGGAFVYAYVLSGTVRSRLDDEPVRTYRQGESWFESPGAHHVLTENVSGSRPARLLVVFVSDTGEPLKTAAESPEPGAG